MSGKVVRISLLIMAIAISSCGRNDPSEINFQNGVYSQVSKKTSSGGRFDIVQYSNDRGDIHLIIPHEPTDLDDFAKIYTNTFKAQGFRMSGSGNEHIGVGPSNVVYLTVSPDLDGLSIFLTKKTHESRTTIEGASGIFGDLKRLP